MAGKPSRIMEQTCPICGEVTVKKTNNKVGRCSECKTNVNRDRVKKWWIDNRSKRGESREEGLMPFDKIAEALGLSGREHAFYYYKKAMRKLQKAVQKNPSFWKELYSVGPELQGECRTQYDNEERMVVSELPIHKFPLQPRPHWRFH